MRRSSRFNGISLLAAGEQDMRFCLPNSRVMVHQPSGGFQGQASDIALHAQEILDLKKRLNMIYVKHTNQKMSAVEKALDRDNFMTPEQSLEWGIIDKIIDRRESDGSDKRRINNCILIKKLGRIYKPTNILKYE